MNEGKLLKKEMSNDFPNTNVPPINKVVEQPSKRHRATMFFSSRRSILTMAFSYPKNIRTVIIDMNEENTPHSPKSSFSYKRERIGVTKNGNMYMMILPNESFSMLPKALFFRMSFNLLFKIVL